MRKLFIVACLAAVAIKANAQAQQYLNFGGLGTGVYAGIEFPVGSVITIGPQISADYNFNNWVFAGKANYYFDELFGITSDWDVYGGVNAGFGLDNDNEGNDDSGLWWGLQIGGRWFWNDKWGLNAEFGGGSGVIGGLGVTMEM